MDLPAARKILGAGIGMCPKEGLFKGYIQLELDVRMDCAPSAFISLTTFLEQLREFDRVRQIYQKYIEWDPTNSASWIKYAELESQLEDFSRTRGIFELGISQPSLSMPELLWKAYIDFETEEGERGKARNLYERLIKLSGHVKVWISYALFEGEAIPVPRSEREEEDDEEEDEEKEVKMVDGDLELARQVFKRGYEDLRSKDLKSEVLTPTCPFTFMLRLTLTPQRVAILEVWKSFEERRGTPADVAKVQEMFPIISLKRVYDPETDTHVEDWVMVFKDDERESNPTSFKFLQMAHAWKAKGKKALPSFGGGAGGKSNEDDGEKEKEKENGGEVKGKSKGKVKQKDDGDEGSDVASSHGGDGDDDD